MSRFVDLASRPVSLGACQCPGTPHEEDVAQIFSVLAWDDLVDIGNAPSEGAARRILVTRAIKSWNLVEEVEVDGAKVNAPVPVTETTVRLLGTETLEAITEAVNEAYERTQDPLPNDSGAPSPDSSSGSASPSQPLTPTPTTSS